MKKIFIVLIVIGIIISIVGIIIAEDLFEKPVDTISNKLLEEGISGMKIINISINELQVKELTKETEEYNLEMIYTKDRNNLIQDIYLTNKLVYDNEFKVSTLIEIEYPEIRWNGTYYKLDDYTKDKPLVLNSWNENGNLIAPNIFFDDIFNKRINYKDVAEQGGYALVYSDKGKYYVELIVTKIIDSLTTEKIDPTYTNTTQGFYIGDVGTNTPGSMVSNNTDIYEMRYNGTLYHWKWDGTFVGSCRLEGSSYYGLSSNSTTNSAIDTIFAQENNGTLMKMDTACNNKAVVITNVHTTLGVNFDVTGVAVNFSSAIDRTPTGFLFSALGLGFIGHTNYAGVNKTGFSTQDIFTGTYNGFDIDRDENNLSKITFIDFTDNYLHTTDYIGTNYSDYSFSTLDGIGADVPRGHSMNRTNHLISDSTDKFIYNVYCDSCYVSVPMQNITGRVVNASDYKAIAGATIIILNANGGFVANTTSNASGYWYYSYTNGTLINYTIVGYNTNNISQGGKAYPFISQAFG